MAWGTNAGHCSDSLSLGVTTNLSPLVDNNVPQLQPIFSLNTWNTQQFSWPRFKLAFHVRSIVIWQNSGRLREVLWWLTAIARVRLFTSLGSFVTLNYCGFLFGYGFCSASCRPTPFLIVLLVIPFYKTIGHAINIFHWTFQKYSVQIIHVYDIVDSVWLGF